jgi:hypothetical protein
MRRVGRQGWAGLSSAACRRTASSAMTANQYTGTLKNSRWGWGGEQRDEPGAGLRGLGFKGLGLRRAP